MKTINSVIIIALLGSFQLAAQTAPPIWSENFSTGIPSTWSNSGVNGFGSPLANALWAYRGPTTTPSSASGSRGLYSGIANNPPTNHPILSPTATNGFVIFDSDYLDNNGIVNNTGNGLAPAPHKSRLITPIINLSLYPNVQLKLNSYHRYYEGRALILFSTNGGLTWSDTVVAHPGIAVNASTSRDAVVSVDVSSIIGGIANARIQFLFDGTFDDPGATGAGRGYYYWMIDDISLIELPKHEVRFTTWNGTPATDIIYGPTTGSSKMGFLVYNFLTDQTRNIKFNANALNFGIDTLHNLKLKVDVYTANNTLVSSFQSANIAVLAPNAIANYTVLNTNQNAWNPNAKDTYRIVYNLISDSTQATYQDTLKVVVGSTMMSNDFGVLSNSLGTPQLGNDGSALASRIDFTEAAIVEKVWVGIGTQTLAGGSVEILVFDSAGFNYANGIPTSSLKAISSVYTITASDVAAGFIQVPFTTPLQVPTNSGYFFAVYMYSNNGTNPITIRNDQSVLQTTFSKIMFNTNTNVWYSGYTNSRTLNSLWIRPMLKDTLAITVSGPTNFCDGQSITLSVPSGLSSYLWNTGATTNSIVVDSTGSYSVIVLINGVYHTLPAISITVHPDPISSLTIIKGSSTLCQGDTAVLQAVANPIYSYQWYNNSNVLVNDTNQTLTVLSPGSYAVRLTNAYNCFNTSPDTTIVFLPLPNTHVSTIGDTIFCIGDSVVLNAIAVSTNTYQWHVNGNSIAGATQPYFSAKVSGVYSVIISNTHSCSEESLPIPVSAIPIVGVPIITGQLVVNPTIQYGYSVSGTSGNTYNWTISNGYIVNGQGTSSVDVVWNAVPSGVLTVTESNGSCENSASLSIQTTIGIDENAMANAINIYPNPSTGLFTVGFANAANTATLEVVNSLGQVLETIVLNDVTENQTQSIDLSRQPSGLYFIRFDLDGALAVKKITKL